jgi:hypothetical protein
MEPKTLCSGTWELQGVIPRLHGACDGELIQRFKAFRAWADAHAR